MEKTRTLDAIPCCPNCASSKTKKYSFQLGGRVQTSHIDEVIKRCSSCAFQWRESDSTRAAVYRPNFKEHRR